MQLPWKKRSDLITTPHDSGGWVVKDPLTLHYTLLDEVEYRVLNLMDGRLSFAALLKAVQRLRPERSFTADDVAAFIGLLAGHQLIRRTVPGDSLRLNPEYSTTGWRRFFGPMFALLRLQLPLVNPSRFLDRLLPWCSWLYSRAAVAVFSTIGIIACLIVLTGFHELRRSLPSMDEFLGASNLLLMFGVFAFVKTLHELGHALTARHFGAECNECGLMLLVFTPVLYTNVSDAWLLPRRQRLLVTAGGILVELSIAATATILWWFATPGLTKSLLLNIMLICSVNTVIFNGNPLLRFDGYFLLADATRLPNLASRASIVVQELIVRILTGRQMNDAEESESRRFLLGYGISSMVYRLFLTLAILQLVQQVTARWHIQFVGTFMSAIMLIGFLVIPLIRFGNQLANSMFTELPEGSALAGFSWFRPCRLYGDRWRGLFVSVSSVSGGACLCSASRSTCLCFAVRAIHTAGEVW